MAYLPSRRMALGLTVTQGEHAAEIAAQSDVNVNYSERLFTEISEYLTPNHPGSFPVG